MKKAIFLGILIFLSFAFIVHADTYANQADITDCSESSPLVTGLIDNTQYDVLNDIDCTADGGTFSGWDNSVGAFETSHISLNLHGYTLYPDSSGIWSTGGGDIFDLEVFNGTLVGSFDILANSAMSQVYLHGMTFNSTNLQLSDGYTYGTWATISDSTFNVNDGNWINYILGVSTDFTNVQVNCVSGTCTDISTGGLVSYATLNFRNVKLIGFTPTTSTGRILLSRLNFFNSSLASTSVSDYAVGSGNPVIFGTGGVVFTFYDQLTVSAKDQNNVNINAMAKVTQVGTNPIINTYPVLNPTENANFGVPNGTGTIFLVKNVTYIGDSSPVFADTSTYDVTVAARSQSQVQQVVFHSPGDLNLTLDFTSEDAGGENTTIFNDTRTPGEKTTNTVMNIYPVIIGLTALLVMGVGITKYYKLW